MKNLYKDCAKLKLTISSGVKKVVLSATKKKGFDKSNLSFNISSVKFLFKKSKVKIYSSNCAPNKAMYRIRISLMKTLRLVLLCASNARLTSNRYSLERLNFVGGLVWQHFQLLGEPMLICATVRGYHHQEDFQSLLSIVDCNFK